MNSGRLDRPITVKNPTFSTNGYGEQIASSYASTSVWAQVISDSGDESLINRVKNSKQVKIFKVRYGITVDEQSLITYNSVDYYVTGIQEVGREDFLLITAQLNKDF